MRQRSSLTGFGRLRERAGDLLTNPPIRDRLMWRGVLQPRPSEDDDRAVHASAFGYIFAIGGVSGVIGLVTSGPLIEDRGVLAIASAGALLISVICLIGYRRLPRRFFHGSAATGTALITLIGLYGSPGSEAVFASLYAFIVIICFLTFRPWPAALQALLAVTAYALVVLSGDPPLALYLWVTSTLMLITLGAVIVILRARTSRIAGELSTDAYTDQLTGLPNRRAFDSRFAVEISRVERTGRPMALIICDLDHFKAVNDTHGHDVGDEVLQRAARAIAKRTRTVDLAARIGGEEFAVLLSDADLEQAAAAAERIRNGIRAEFDGTEISLTASCGVAGARSGPLKGTELFEEADKALYAGKRAGRDCTALYEGGEIRVIGGGSAVGRLRQLL